MPTPLELLLDPITLTAIGIYIALIVWEALAPARRLPAVRGWRGRALLSFIVYLLISGYLPWLWADLAGSLRLFDLTSLPTWAGATIGVLVYELGAWIYHRAPHGSSFLWRCVHQWHHSSERLDAWSAFWFSPYDMAGWTALASFALSIVVGLSPEATFAAVVTITFFTIFQHTNVRTPRWLGYIVQRPESHSWHHARGVHAGNYSDLPVFDLLFGTLNNPPDFAPEQGFYDGASSRLIDMLRGRDVAAPPAASTH
nr:MAG: fatty acid hydroxylase [Pseudomonadota bacterium]